jgi:hypothetical protein
MRIEPASPRTIFFNDSLFCLNCHASGALVRSVFTRPDGVPLEQPAG